MVAQQLFQSRDIAGDDCVGSTFEVSDGRVGAGFRFEVLRELGPAFEAVGAGDDELSGG